MVKKINPDGSRTIYIGGVYEVNKDASGRVTGTTTYYAAAGAMRVNGVLYFTLGDQVGSTSVVANASGTVVGTQGYYPFGGTRYSTGTLYTDRLYTGQQEISGLGLYNYKARFYDPVLGRFISPDNITPGGTQGLNRYSYSNNSPINFNDPTGHMADECGDFGCGADTPTIPIDPITPDNNDNNPQNPPDTIGNRYKQGWEYFGDSWSILKNREADPLFKAYAATYMVAWGGAHLALAAGTTTLAYGALVEFATINAGAAMASIGSNGLYQKAGYTFFELPDKLYDALGVAAKAVNISVMSNQIAQEKDVVVSLFNIAKPGPGTSMEMAMLSKAGIYVEGTANFLGNGVSKIFQVSPWQWLK